MSEAFHEVVVEGPLTVLRGFVTGLLVARGLDARAVLFAEEHSIHGESFTEQLAEWLRLQANLSHVIVPQALVADMKADFHKAAETVRLQIKSDRPIRSASFEFSYSAYSPRHAQELDELVKRFSDKVRLSEDYQPVEVLERNAHLLPLIGDALEEIAADLLAVLELQLDLGREATP